MEFGTFLLLQSPSAESSEVVFGRGLDESPDVAKTIRSAVERSRGLVLNLLLKAGEFFGDYVGEVCDDPIESIGHGPKQICLKEVDLDRVPNTVLASKAKCFLRNIGCPDGGTREFQSQRNRDDSRARANIKNADLLWAAGKMLKDQLHELLRLRPGNKRPAVA